MPTPFGTTVLGVRALVLDVAAAGQRLGAREERVSDDQVREWLDEAGARVALRVAGWEQLPRTIHVRVEQVARHLTHLYAAALLWDATHPERGGVGGGGTGTRLSDSLMARYTEGLTDLDRFVRRALEDVGAEALEGPQVVDVGLAEAHFPPPRFTERTGW